MSGLVEVFLENAAITGFRSTAALSQAIADALVSDAAYALADTGSVVLLSSDSRAGDPCVLGACHSGQRRTRSGASLGWSTARR